MGVSALELRRRVLMAQPHKERKTGGIVSFNTHVPQVLGVAVPLSPVQAGTGDPSPENIRPITGRDGVTLWRTGKNLAPPGYLVETITNGVTITPTANGIKVVGTSTGRFALNLMSIRTQDRHIPLVKGEKVTFSLLINGDISGLETPFVGYYANNAYGGNIGQLSESNEYKRTWTVAQKYADANDSYVRAYAYIPNNTVCNFEIGFQMEISDKASEYAEYSGESFPFTFPDTVYGGRLEPAAGRVVVDRAMVTFDGTQPDSQFSLSKYPDSNPLRSRISWAGIYAANGGKIGGKYISDTLVGDTEYANVPLIWHVANSSALYARMFIGVPPTITTVADWQSYVTQNPISVIYELADPIVIPLTPAEIRALMGENNVFSDAGDVEVEFWTN